MKFFEHIYNALYHPPNEADAVGFSGGFLMLSISPFVGWFINLITAVLVAFLSRLFWEFSKPFVAWLTGRLKVKSFTDVTIDKEDNIFEDKNKD